MSKLRSRLERLQGIKKEEASEQATQSSALTINESTEERDIKSELTNHLSEGNSIMVNKLLSIREIGLEQPYAQAWRSFQITEAENEFGSFYIRQLRYRAKDAIGMHRYGEWTDVAAYMNAFFSGQNPTAEQYLFLDLETTGLGSGTGNVPFMIGLAFWEGDHLHVQQAFIRHPAEERAMLAYLHYLTKNFTHLVTYNGKSFDWPLIRSRYILHGMREEIWEPFHVDLLHPSRAIWRNTLESCKLSYIEKMRLGIVRVDDLPGAEAPARYFAYLSNGDPSVLFDVYRHNEIDMLSLVTLAIRFGHLLSNKTVESVVQQPTEPEELVRTGLWLEKMGLDHYPEQLFQLAVYIPKQKNNTRMLLAARDKKMNNIERAVQLWHEVVQSASLLIKKEHVEAAIELSMYYEHKVKQYEQALCYAERAHELYIEHIPARKKDKAVKKKDIEQLINRIERIKKKCGFTV